MAEPLAEKQVTLDDAVRRVRYEGWCALDAVIPPDQVAAVRDEVVRIGEAQRPKEWDGRDHIDALINKTQVFAPYVTDHRILGVAEALFGPHVRISMTHGHTQAPGYTRNNWHGDWPFSLTQDSIIKAPYTQRQPVHVTTLWALTGFNSETGGTVIVPGSHTAGNSPGGDLDYDQFQPIASERQPEMQPGDVLVFDSRMWHTNGTNHSDELRVSMAVRYAPWWLNVLSVVPGLAEYEETVRRRDGLRAHDVMGMSREVFDALPAEAQTLFRHMLVGQRVPSAAEVLADA